MAMTQLVKDTDQFASLSRYLSGQLNDAEAAQLEGDWASNPNWLADMELDARIQSGLSELRRTRQLESAVRGPWWTKSLRILSLAASVTAVGIALWIWQVAARSDVNLLARAPALALGDSVAVMRLRQSSPVAAVVELTHERRSIELRVMPEVRADAIDAPANVIYSMSLQPAKTDAARSPFAVENLTMGQDGFVRAYLDSGQIAPGRYRLLLRRAGATEPDEFLIEVALPAASPDAN
jgi:hypothetical protein